MAKTRSIALLIVLMACATAQVLAQASVQFVPGGCTLNTPTVTAQRGWNPWIVTGTVTLINKQSYNVPLQSVQVAISNSIPVAPIYVQANCPSSYVPFSPVPYQYGTLTCTYTAILPFGWNRWPSSNPAAWTSASATAMIGVSGAKCSSGSTPISGNCWGLSSGSQWTDVATAATRVGVGSSGMVQQGQVNTPEIGTGASNQQGTVDTPVISTGASNQQGTVNTPVISTGASNQQGSVNTPIININTAGGSAAGSGATGNTADVASSTGNRKLLQAVQFVPQGCSGLKVAATAHSVGSNIVGKVTLSNPNTFNIPVTQVQVMLANNIPVAPMYLTAFCGGATHVPFSPIPYEQGTLTCYFSQALPSNGPANSPSAWTSVRATATIGMSGASCPSPVTPIQQLLLGRK